MFKRVIALLFVMLMFTACSGSSVDVKKDYEFEFENFPKGEYIYSMYIYPPFKARNQDIYKFNIPEPYAIEPISETEVDAHYELFDEYTEVTYGRVRVNAAPGDMAGYFKTDDPTKISELMVSQFFPAMEVYEGLKRNVVDDFGYELLVDWTGTAFGYDAFFLEFFDEESGNHAMRFYFSNDEMNENFYAYEFKVDIPLEEKDRIDHLRKIIFTTAKVNE